MTTPTSRFHARLRFALGALLALAMTLSTAACAFGTADEASPSPSAKDDGPITLVASLNQWGSLAAQIGGDEVRVTSILTSTTADAHDFEPTSQDVRKLHDADIALVNGAGYDAWASKGLPSSVTCVSVADIVGAVEGDNPHLWFSRDARFAIAAELADVFTRLRPEDKDVFAGNLNAWKSREEKLEDRIHAFGESHPDLSYAATEAVAYYLMSDLGFDDKTPAGYAQAVASEAEPAAADLRRMREVLADGEVNLLVDNPQESDDMTKGLVQDADKAGVPVLSVTEQMPEGVKTLTDWIDALFTQITKKIDPEYVETNARTADGDAADDDAR